MLRNLRLIFMTAVPFDLVIVPQSCIAPFDVRYVDCTAEFVSRIKI